jgi:hypothetical protein
VEQVIKEAMVVKVLVTLITELVEVEEWLLRMEQMELRQLVVTVVQELIILLFLELELEKVVILQEVEVEVHLMLELMEPVVMAVVVILLLVMVLSILVGVVEVRMIIQELKLEMVVQE